MHTNRKCDGKLHFTLVFQTFCFQGGGGEKAQTQQGDRQKEGGKNAKTTEPFFLVARSASVCRAAVTELAVSCVVSRHYDRDDALSKERWRIQTRLAVVHNERGARLFNHANPRHAAVEFSRAIECNPRVPAFYVNMPTLLHSML